MNKPNLLFGTVGWNIAETTRMIEVAKAARTHFEPHFASYGGSFEHLITEAGFPLHHLAPEETPEKIDYLWRVDRMETIGQPFTVEELRTRVANELALIDQLQPAAVAMGSVLTMPISARVARVPLVNIVPLAMTRPYLQAGLPLSPDLPRLPLLYRVANWLTMNVPLLTRNFSIVAHEHGLPAFRSLLDVWEGDHNLVAEIPLLSGVPVLPPNWHYVGPIFAHLAGDVPPAVQALAQARDKPLVYFAMGSSGNRDIVRTVVSSFAGLPVNVVAPIQSHLDEDTVVPENVLVTGWLPAPQVNAMADIAVIHGGQGTVQTACASGTPFVGIGMQPEQAINIEGVVRFGSARRISKSKVTIERVQNEVLALLQDGEARRKAHELKEVFAQWDGAQAAADFLIAEVGNPQHPANIPLTPYTARRAVRQPA
jgi:UDP:flavonoid glycosyltransferase YjiC (YdhE family)